jgi:hypothetical protein
LRNLGISSGEGGLNFKFPVEGAFRLWNSKGKVILTWNFQREG